MILCLTTRGECSASDITWQNTGIRIKVVEELRHLAQEHGLRKVLKELLTYEGVASAGSGSPREIIKQAFRFYPCIEEDVWLSMLAQRNNLSHIYDAQAARRLMETIIRDYIPAFQKLEDSILRRYQEILETL